MTSGSPAVPCPGSISASASAAISAAEPALAHHSTAWQLPVELLLQCLIAADLVTRIRASHVSRTWREASLSERRLWDRFACSRFRDKQHEDAMFGLLETMLLRSRPLPFHLKMPHIFFREGCDYTNRFLGLKDLDVFRLAAYQGPARLFRLLNPTCASLRNLLSLNVFGDPKIETVDLVAQFGVRCLPNLRQLTAPNVRLPVDCTPFGELRYLTLEGNYGHHHRALFTHFPSLVRMSIVNSASRTPLPDPPIPLSLEEVILSCTTPRELELLALMQHWHGVCVRRLVVYEVYSLRGIIPLFLASHQRPIELRLVGDKDETVVISTIPEGDSVWTLSPAADWAYGFLTGIEKPTSERLTSLCVAFSRLEALLAAQLHMLGLKRLELCVCSAADTDPPPLLPADETFLRAPRLRCVSFNLGRAFSDSLEDALGVLRSSFCALFVYDAVLLDRIAVSHPAERACAGFAPFAKEYVISAR